MRRGFLAALVITGPSPAALFAQAKPDSLVKPAVRYGYAHPFDQSARAEFVADSSDVVDVIRKHLGDRLYEIAAVQLFFRDWASVQAKAGDSMSSQGERPCEDS